MDCRNCGTKLPDEANFCWNCGQPTNRRTLKSKNYGIKICRIHSASIDKFFSGHYVRYEARVDGKVIDQTPDIKVGSDSSPIDVDEAFGALLERLQSQGWEAISTNASGQINTLHKRFPH